MTTNNHGGSRPNSGRPKGKPTKVLTYRVPLYLAKKIDRLIRSLITETITMADFKHLGYFKEFYIGNKFIGNLSLTEPDRELTGYAGRIFETTTDQIILENGKKIKAGTNIMTMVYPLNGRKL